MSIIGPAAMAVAERLSEHSHLLESMVPELTAFHRDHFQPLIRKELEQGGEIQWRQRVSAPDYRLREPIGMMP